MHPQPHPDLIIARARERRAAELRDAERRALLALRARPPGRVRLVLAHALARAASRVARTPVIVTAPRRT